MPTKEQGEQEELAQAIAIDYIVQISSDKNFLKITFHKFKELICAMLYFC